jgi:phage shock protein PspC (stress-responsive transcriptional regulator)
MEKKLYRDEHKKVIGGVCAGLADYFGIDVSIVRAIFLLTLILKGGGLLVYIVLWIVLPKRNYDFYTPGVDYRVPPQQDSFNPFSSAAPQPGSPFVNPPKKQASTVGLIFGVILILIGASCLLNEFDILPDWDFEKLWPVVLVVIGFALMASGKKNKPWENANWQHTGGEVKDAPAKEDGPAPEDNFKETPPNV